METKQAAQPPQGCNCNVSMRFNFAIGAVALLIAVAAGWSMLR